MICNRKYQNLKEIALNQEVNLKENYLLKHSSLKVLLKIVNLTASIR